ncbi:hypothetical protein ACSXEP_15570 (plasmid) [Clostridium perfringens]
MDKKAREKARYEYLKSRNICVKCAKEKALKNSIYCLTCKMDAREADRKYIEKHKKELRAKAKIKNAIIYKERKVKGLCVKCGTKKAPKGFVTCETCRAKARNKYKSKKEEREYLNLCRMCGAKDLYKNTKICEKCYKERIVKMRNSNKKCKKENHYWNKLNKSTFNKGCEKA